MPGLQRPPGGPALGQSVIDERSHRDISFLGTASVAFRCEEAVKPICELDERVLAVGSHLETPREAGHLTLVRTRALHREIAARLLVSSNHRWTITSGFDALSAHVLIGQGEDCHARRREIE